jgi:hypothetical protein
MKNAHQVVGVVLTETFDILKPNSPQRLPADAVSLLMRAFKKPGVR